MARLGADWMDRGLVRWWECASIESLRPAMVR